uniref:Uncharacterized protein n=1 Tax=Utricularia reniformis TaxID=192314 RepID=A0A1Y0B1P7_9LAMI|nr:hypothetical protein AEK19_MT1158 [Utricularia reniformis]ART31372.1 hypothetical protein AEK19_MT1158 [Utricularia reniformis]
MKEISRTILSRFLYFNYQHRKDLVLSINRSIRIEMESS